MVRALIQMGAHVDEVDERGRCALHGCVKRGHLGVLGVLIKLGADVNRQAHGQAQEAALHVAARGRFSASVRLLLQVCMCVRHLGAHFARTGLVLTAARSWDSTELMSTSGRALERRRSTLPPLVCASPPWRVACMAVCGRAAVRMCVRACSCVHVLACSDGRLKVPRQTNNAEGYMRIIEQLLIAGADWSLR